MRSTRRLRTLPAVVSIAVAVAFLTIGSGRTAAAMGTTNDGEDPAGARASRGLDRESVGFEVPLVSVGLKEGRGFPSEQPSSVQAGGGLSVRVHRLRWDHAFFTPLAFGLFRSSDNTFVHAHTEAGLIVPGTGRRLELGAALGIGVLRMSYSTHCDGDCNVGGVGVMFSPVARFLIVSRPDFTFGVNGRVVLPLSGHNGRSWFGGEYNGFGSVLLGGIEVGFGRLGSR